MSSLLKLLNVSYQHNNGGGGVRGISFEIEPRELVLLVGRTGAGKTTIMRLLSMELVPMAGELSFTQYKSSALKTGQLRCWRRRLGIVYQDFRLLKDRSALENVHLSAFCERNLPGKPRLRALKAMARMGLAHKLHCRPDELSTGEQQRTALARALVNEPYLLLADEPVSNLDDQTATELIEYLRRFNQAGTAMLIATHQPERFASCSPRTIRVENGRLVDPC